MSKGGEGAYFSQSLSISTCCRNSLGLVRPIWRRRQSTEPPVNGVKRGRLGGHRTTHWRVCPNRTSMSNSLVKEWSPINNPWLEPFLAVPNAESGRVWGSPPRCYWRFLVNAPTAELYDQSAEGFVRPNSFHFVISIIFTFIIHQKASTVILISVR